MQTQFALGCGAKPAPQKNCKSKCKNLIDIILKIYLKSEFFLKCFKKNSLFKKYLKKNVDEI